MGIESEPRGHHHPNPWAFSAGHPQPDGSLLIPARITCAGTQLDLNPAFLELRAVVTADPQGEISVGPLILPAGAFGGMRMQALDLSTCETSNRIRAVF